LPRAARGEGAWADSQRWFWLALLLLSGWLLWLLAPVLTPFLAAAILAYIGDPVVDRLEERGHSRTRAVVLVFAAFSLLGLMLLLILLPMLQRQLVLLVDKVPAFFDWLQHWLLPRLSDSFGTQIDLDVEALRRIILENWKAAGGAVARVVGELSRSGVAVLAGLANLVLVPVVSFYLLRDWDHLVARIRELLPRRIESEVVRLATASDEVLAAFLRGQLLVMAVLGFIYSLGLWLVGLDLALLIGLLAGTVSFVPYLGFIVGIVAAGVAALMQFQDLLHLLLVLAVFGVGQVIEGLVLQPILLGDRIGLHPVAVIFAVLAGGQLFGFFGILLALPVAAVVAVLLRYAHERYLASQIYAGCEDDPPT